MRNMASTLATTLVAACLAGCQTTTGRMASQPAAPPSTNLVLTGSWNLLQLNEVPVQSGAAVLRLQADGRFVATVYCNEARGLYRLQGRSLSFDGWDATERGCNGTTSQAGAIGSALRGDNYIVSLDANGDLLLAGPARLRFRRS